MVKILVVDDEPRVVNSLRALLTESEYDVVVAKDGKAALSVEAAESPDLVILDIMLPGLSGLEVCRAIKRKSQVPILMLTAKGGEEDKVVGLDIGADDYVTKPFDYRELLARIRALLRRSGTAISGDGAPAANPVSAEELRIDLFSRRATFDGRYVPLKTKEFDLLAFLISHRGTIFSQQELLERVWGYSAEDNTRTVAVHVRGLRAKLEAYPGAAEWIETVRGSGYRFKR